MARALDLISTWPVPTAAAAVLRGSQVVDQAGPTDHQFRLASISKPIASWAILVAVEEGTVSLEDPVGHATLRHLLAHAGGYPFDGPDPITAPERKRIYSNTGIELAAEHLASAADMSFEEYLDAAVFAPLAMTSTQLRGSPAHAMYSTVDDLVRFVAEVTTPRLVTQATADAAAQPHFPLLGGIVPGVGRFDTCPWGLGFEIRGDKSPHWTGEQNSTRTFGHFGGAGTMTWIDPVHDLSVVALTDRTFDEWATEALELWPAFSDAVISEFSSQ